MTALSRPFPREELEAVLARTERALAAQGWVPESPGRPGPQGPALCAGAMLVREALAHRRQDVEAQRFAEQVVTRDRAFICDAARQAGLDVEIVRRRIIENDRAPPSVRLESMLKQLGEMRTPAP